MRKRNNLFPAVNRCSILANGMFPKHPIPLAALKNSEFMVCCDGAVNSLTGSIVRPDIIIGDMDSIKPEMQKKYEDRMIYVPEQNTNDLEKAIRWCHSQGINNINILGATGKREDHSIGNIFLLIKYAHQFNDIRILTDFGIFQPVWGKRIFSGFPTQQVSIFSPDPKILIDTFGLKYPLEKTPIRTIHSGTLNESISTEFSISISEGVIILFTVYKGIS